MKRFWITNGRERDLIRYSESSDLKDAKECSFEDAKKRLLEKNPGYEGKADAFLKRVMQNPFNDWVQF